MHPFSIFGTTAFLLAAILAPGADYFTPTHRLAGIGVDRPTITDAVLAARTERMIESQTFGILRDPKALAGAKRINSPELQKIFRDAERVSGLPADLIASVAYLESWGEPRAESPAGPKGIMQFSEATARRAGLQIVHATRYRTIKETLQVKNRRGKVVKKTVRRKVPYTVLVRDDRFTPARAVPAAARYLSAMETKFGGQDWAVFAYHCGEGCVGNFLDLASNASLKHKPPTVASVFFAGSPAQNRELYEAIQTHMERDFSPTYWFRIMRARQLLAMYREDPDRFKQLFNEYRYQPHPEQRAPNRLSVWLRAEDLVYQTETDMREERGKKLVRILEDPRHFNFSLRRSGAEAIAASDAAHQEDYLQASPAAAGTLAYIAFETRRLFDAMPHNHEKWAPLEVTGLVFPANAHGQKCCLGERDEQAPEHGSGQVFDLATANLPAAERECLQFILSEMGWDGYLGYVQESSYGGTLHIGCSPSSREFFSQIFEEAMKNKKS